MLPIRSANQNEGVSVFGASLPKGTKGATPAVQLHRRKKPLRSLDFWGAGEAVHRACSC